MSYQKIFVQSKGTFVLSTFGNKWCESPLGGTPANMEYGFIKLTLEVKRLTRFKSLVTYKRIWRSHTPETTRVPKGRFVIEELVMRVKYEKDVRHELFYNVRERNLNYRATANERMESVKRIVKRFFDDDEKCTFYVANI